MIPPPNPGALPSRRTCLFALFLLFAPSSLLGATVTLQPGMSYQAGDTTVQCVAGTDPEQEEVVVENCRRFDKYEKRCLDTVRELRRGSARCVEECQHWDDYEKRCLYRTRCTPAATGFLRRDCRRFDAYSAACLEEGERFIGPAAAPPSPAAGR